MPVDCGENDYPVLLERHAPVKSLMWIELGKNRSNYRSNQT